MSDNEFGPVDLTSLARGQKLDAQILEGALRRAGKELEKCREENQLLNALFDMQQTRMKKAIKLWQKATGKKDTLPDLGVLLEWLMAELKEAKHG